MRVSSSSVRIEAPREIVWSVVTEPSYVKQWQYGSDLSTDWAAGCPIRFTSEWEGQIFEQWGTVLEVDPPVMLRYSLFAPRPDLVDRAENYFTMTYTLAEDAGATILTITQEDPRPGTGEPDESAEADNPVLAALKGVAESAVAQ